MEQFDLTQKVDIKLLPRLSRSIDFSRFHNTAEVHDDLEPVMEKVRSIYIQALCNCATRADGCNLVDMQAVKSRGHAGCD